MIRLAVPLICSFLFVLIGLAFVPEAGIQNDEALFGSGIYEQVGIADGIAIAGHRIPLMLMSYLGALKSWIYSPIFRLWEPSPASLRVPVLFAGGFTIWLFWNLLRKVADDRAAVVGCFLLSTDTLFQITTCFDWGPVVIQHLTAVSGTLCLAHFYQKGHPRFLVAGFFVLGLGLWDKALFAWILSGMAIATVVVFPRELWTQTTLRNLIVSVLAFCLGCAPLLAYNFRFPLQTFRANAAYASDDVPGKTRMLRTTFSGGALLGFISRDGPVSFPSTPQTFVQRTSLWVSEKTGAQRMNFFDWAMAVSLFLLPWLWFTPARRPLAFSLIAMLIAWLQMLFTKNTGGSVHHVILLWPLPVFFVAIAFAEASRRIGRIGIPVLATVVLFLASTSALVTNEYLVELVRNGPTREWTDAIYPLSDYLSRVKTRAIYINDWGMFDNLRLLNQGKLPLRVGGDLLSTPAFTEADKRLALERISESDSIFVSHTDDNELFTGINARYRSLAEEGGTRRQMLARISDRNGRPMFEVFRFERTR